MTKMEFTESEQRQERFGRAFAARLSAGTAELPYHVGERLRASRTQALERHMAAQAANAPVVIANGKSASLTFGSFSLWRQLATALPLLVLAVGLVLIQTVQDERRASELAEVDTALLTDDLPPAAYADAGFVQFLKSGLN